MTIIKLQRELQGSILDIGGGGEGIIGRMYGQQVTAIDNRQEELDEAPNGFSKVLMDAEHLTFADETFDNATFFYSLMYMSKDTQEKAIAEAVRVLKADGKLIIWDAVIDNAYPEPFLAKLSIDVNGELVQTTYGIIKPDAAQDIRTFIGVCEKNGLRLRSKEIDTVDFKLTFQKMDKQSFVDRSVI